LFDSLTLVASGKLMFHGPAQEALGYFESAGMVDFPVVGALFIDSWNRAEGSVVVMFEVHIDVPWLPAL
jgi:hypothetical protein